MELKDRLRELRESIVLEDGKKCSQKQFAEIIGVKQNNYNNWENGREPNLQTLIKIADYYGVTLDYLVGHSDYKQPELRGICEETGLSENAVKGIIRYVESDAGKFALNTILEQFYSCSCENGNGQTSILQTIDSMLSCYVYPDYPKPLESAEDAEKYNKLRVSLEREMIMIRHELEQSHENDKDVLYGKLGVLNMQLQTLAAIRHRNQQQSTGELWDAHFFASIRQELKHLQEQYKQQRYEEGWRYESLGNGDIKIYQAEASTDENNA